jgi:hypothetical protein
VAFARALARLAVPVSLWLLPAQLAASQYGPQLTHGLVAALTRPATRDQAAAPTTGGCQGSS